MRRAIETLAQNYDTPIEQLEEYKNYIETHLNPEVYEIINQQFRPMGLKVGTAGAYLWGCNQNYYGNVSKSCSALCHGSLPYENSKSCQYQIWTYNDDLKCNEKISSSIAYIYLDRYKQFSKKDIEKLKEANVTHVTVLITENNQHKTIIPLSDIENLPLQKEEVEIEEEVSYKYYYIIIFLIIILFFTKLYKFF